MTPATAKKPKIIWIIIRNARSPPSTTGADVAGSISKGSKPGKPRKRKQGGQAEHHRREDRVDLHECRDDLDEKMPGQRGGVDPDE